jgi:predicted nucleic acid-binding protein
MRGEAFIDTNVLVYFTGRGNKSSTAETLIIGGATISVQVLNELTLVLRRKHEYSWQEIREVLSFLQGLLSVTALTIDTHELGLSLAERYRLRLYDSLLLAAALQAGCKTFWSEDMQDGLVLEDMLTVRNPFRQT